MMNNLDIQNLETKIAFLERHVEEQDKEIFRLNRELAIVAKGLTDLRDKFDSQSETKKTSDENERPPHY